MNKSEQKAEEWLQKQGYTTIQYHSHSTPDFTTDGGGFEVKTLSKFNTIIFRTSQFKSLQQQYPPTIILVYNNLLEQVASFPFSMIADGQKRYKHIRIVTETPLVEITLPKDLRERLKARKRPHQALAGVIEELLNTIERQEKLHSETFSKLGNITQ